MRMSAQRDEQKLADGLTGRPTAFALSPGPKGGVTRTHMGPMEQDHMATRSQNHLPSYPPVCLRVSALYSFFFFFKLSAQKHTLALLTLEKYGLTGPSFDKNYTFQ